MSTETVPQDGPNGNAQRPLEMVSNGRRPNGTFAPGHKFATGNGISRKVARFRTSMFAAAKAGDVRAIVAKLIAEAKAGEPWAVKLALEYLCGPPRDVALEERLSAIEESLKTTGEP